MKNLIEEKLKKNYLITKFKYFFYFNFLLIFNNLLAYEIIRDPIFEDYFSNLSKDLNINKIDVYLVDDDSANAFVIKDDIYFSTGLLNEIHSEDTLKAIYLHEYAHIIKNHFESKKIKTQQYNTKNTVYSLFSLGLAVLTSNTNIAIGTSITLNSNLIKEISKHSVNFEIEADYFMIERIKKNKINTIELISFLNKSVEPANDYFRTHPNKQDRVNNLKKLNFKKTNNSIYFEWIKSKYSNNSKIQSFNNFFKDLEKGIFNQEKELAKINKQIIQYEVYKKGIFIDNWSTEFQELLKINNNSYLKIEYINYLLDNNFIHNYYIIEDLKFDKDIMNEFFYYYIYGKYYTKINNTDLSNFYFCQFYKSVNLRNKADFFCKKYDIKDIPTLDKSHAIFK